MFSFDEEMLMVAVDNVVNGLNACSLSLDVMYKLSDLINNGWYDVAYDFVCDLDTKMNDSDRLSLKYVLYHAKEDKQRLLIKSMNALKCS